MSRSSQDDINFFTCIQNDLYPYPGGVYEYALYDVILQTWIQNDLYPYPGGDFQQSRVNPCIQKSFGG